MAKRVWWAGWPRSRAPGAMSTGLLALTLAAHGATGGWRPVTGDGLHDPANAASRLLQEPRDALARLPSNPLGNRVNWVEALEKELIKPRDSISARAGIRHLATDVLMKNTATMPNVRFSHRVHTLWLDCTNCHERIFRTARAANPMTMLEMLRGERCGTCHGAVAFPLSDCLRCHNVASAGAAAAR